MGDGATFTWYGQSCVELRTPGGRTVLFDPWFGNPTSVRSAGAVGECHAPKRGIATPLP